MQAIAQGVNVKILARLVGYLEYKQSLDHFQRFLASATPDELAAADELVRDRDELVVYTNLSQLLDPAARVADESRASAADTFERRGLEWVIALARLEHQAMLVGFTAEPAPLLDSLPPAHAGEAYSELLLDGARMHYFAWRQAREKARGGLPLGPDLISEARRAALTIELLQAAEARRSEAIGETIGEAAGETAGWRQELERYLDQVVERIRSDNELLPLAGLDAPRVVPPVP